MRPIDADKLLAELKSELPIMSNWGETFVPDLIQRQPTVHVEPVVRCCECVWRGREECAMFYRCECGEQHTWESDDDFCSYGERNGT